MKNFKFVFSTWLEWDFKNKEQLIILFISVDFYRFDLYARDTEI